MSFPGQIGWALARGLAVAACCVLVGLPLRDLVAGSRGWARRVLWAALLAPFLTPALLVGYAYSNFSLSLVRHPGWNEILYGALLWMRFTPVAALVLYVAPSPVSAEAAHCHRLLRKRERGVRMVLQELAFLARGPMRAWALAFAVAFLLAFSEFEMASPMGIRTWTVALFDAHAGGLPPSESIRRAALPAAIEMSVLGFVLVTLLRSRSLPAPPGERRAAWPAALKAALWGYLAAGSAAAVLVPSAVVLRGTVAGLRIVLENFVLAGDIGAAVLFGAAGGACAYALAAWLVGRAGHAEAGRFRLVCICVLCVPGLLGPLVLSLLTVAAFQAPGLGRLYDGPVPLIVALTAVLLPMGFALWAAVRAFRPAQALHCAGLMGASPSARVRGWRRRLRWQLETRRQFWVLFLLFCWGYFDLTASAILAPPGMTPVMVRLYNLTHYGQTAVLSAMLCVAFLTPALALLALGGARGLFARVAAHE